MLSAPRRHLWEHARYRSPSPHCFPCHHRCFYSAADKRNPHHTSSEKVPPALCPSSHKIRPSVLSQNPHTRYHPRYRHNIPPTLSQAAENSWHHIDNHKFRPHFPDRCCAGIHPCTGLPPVCRLTASCRTPHRSLPDTAGSAPRTVPSIPPKQIRHSAFRSLFAYTHYVPGKESPPPADPAD